MNKLKHILSIILKSLIYIITLLIIIILIPACPLIVSKPDTKTIAQRIESFPNGQLPVEKPITIYWNEHLVPFIEAETDEDGAFALGLVNAHLRLGQMELFRMIYQGRTAEMAGPWLADIDAALRTIQFDRNVDEMIRLQTDKTRLWVENYVRGINYYKSLKYDAPFEDEFLNLDTSAWTVHDVYGVARLLSADLTWGVYAQFLSISKEKDWEKLWAEYLKFGQKSIPSYPTGGFNGMMKLIDEISKSGSNSLVVGSQKSSTGGALMANDPHLGIFTPNMWIMVGYKTPSYHLVGFQIPGIPFVGVGRNMNIAWGGTNMRSISSHLIEPDSAALLEVEMRTERIHTRWWFDKEIQIRTTKYGPIISDLKMFESNNQIVALQWLGHDSSNELECFLAANRASDFQQFRDAFKEYKVSGQAMTYADNKGNIGEVLAYAQPLLTDNNSYTQLIKSFDNSVVSVRSSYQLPFAYNPPAGFIASANNMPFETDIPIALEYSGYNRMKRMADICTNSDSISIETLKVLQTDVWSDISLVLRDSLLHVVNNQTTQIEKSFPEMWKEFTTFNGEFHKDSRAALVFFMVMYQLTTDLLPLHYTSEAYIKLMKNDNNWLKAMEAIISKSDAKTLAAQLYTAFKKAQKDTDNHRVWGDVHRLEIGPFISRIPVLGKKFVKNEMPVSGTTNTLMKTAHEFTNEINSTYYGSCSRHISDLTDPDANWFLLLGGQDGDIGSAANADQIELWEKGDYIQMPLQLETVRKLYNFHVTRFIPAN